MRLSRDVLLDLTFGHCYYYYVAGRTEEITAGAAVSLSAKIFPVNPTPVPEVQVHAGVYSIGDTSVVGIALTSHKGVEP